MDSYPGDFPFGIMDVVELLHLRIRRRQANSVYVDCPFCGDRRGKMNVNFVKNVWRCNYCDEHGGMLALYARLNNTTTSDAYWEIGEALCNDFHRERPNSGYEMAGNQQAGTGSPVSGTQTDLAGYERRGELKTVQQAERASGQKIHQTLSLLLAMLPLQPAHRNHLHSPKRGLSDEQIDRIGFKSTPPPFLCRSITERLMKQGCKVEGVPGFYLDDSGRWTMNFYRKNAGILIPAVGYDGMIHGLQILLDIPLKQKDDPPDKAGAKYIWFSSSSKNMGVTSGSPVHFIGDPSARVVYVIEGLLKADISHCLTNRTFVAIAGANNWKQVRKDILTTDADWLDLKEKLAFSDDFVEQNRETVTEFLLQGGAAMVCALYGELDGQELAVEALRRIVQAELMGQFYKLKYFAGDLQREIRYPVSEMQESFWKKNLSLARGAFWAEEVDDFYHTLRLGELPHSTCLSYRTGSQRECLLAAFDSNKKIVLVKKDEAVVARACLRLTKGAFQKPPAVDFSFADLSQENMDSGKPVTSEKPVLFLESIYTFGLNDIEKEEVMKLAVSLTTQKAAELGIVAVLARRYLGCYERDEYVLAPFYVYISKSKNGWQYLDSLGGAAYTSAKEEYVEHPFLVIQTAMHHAGAHNRNEVDYE